MPEPQRFSEQVGAVVGGEAHRVRLLRVLLHRDRELVARRRLHRRHDTDKLLIRPLRTTVSHFMAGQNIHILNHFMAITYVKRLASVSRHPQLKLEDFVGAKFYCLHALVDGN